MRSELAFAYLQAELRHSVATLQRSEGGEGGIRPLSSGRSPIMASEPLLAEGVGFEPTVHLRQTAVFETAPFGHSGIPPFPFCHFYFLL